MSVKYAFNRLKICFRSFKKRNVFWPGRSLPCITPNHSILSRDRPPPPHPSPAVRPHIPPSFPSLVPPRLTSNEVDHEERVKGGSVGRDRAWSEPVLQKRTAWMQRSVLMRSLLEVSVSRKLAWRWSMALMRSATSLRTPAEGHRHHFCSDLNHSSGARLVSCSLFRLPGRRRWPAWVTRCDAKAN
jgi:hypothetical protein